MSARRALAILPAIVLFACLVWHYYPFFADDGLISLRYAQRLLAGDGLTWTDGERVEGYSNLLYILATAFLGSLGFDLILAARVVGVSSVLALFVAVERAWPVSKAAGPWPASIANLLVAASAPVAVWAVGGLEQTLFVALLAWGLVLAFPLLEDAPGFGEGLGGKQIVRRSLPLALLCLTRPDGPLFVVAIAGSIVALRAFRRRAWREALTLVSTPCLTFLGQLCFRWFYYGDWVPNTAHVKASVSSQSVERGLDYLASVWSSSTPLLPLVVLGVMAVAAGHQRRRGGLILACFGLWALYVVAVGGDIFPAYRHHVPLLVLAIFVTAIGVDWALQSVEGRARLTLLTLVGGMCGLLVQAQLRDGENQRAERERWEWDGQVVGRMFRAGFGDRNPLFAVTAAGCLPYFSELPSLDMLGLNDRHIAQQPASSRHGLGHDHGDGDYVLEREPDLILFGTPRGHEPTGVSGLAMKDDRRFRRGYQRVKFEGFAPYLVPTALYLKKTGAVGLRVGKTRAEIPGYLFEGTVGGLGPDGQMMARVHAGRTHRSPRLKLRAGAWRVRLDPPNPRVEVTLESPEALRAQGEVFVLDDKTSLYFRVRGAEVDTLLGTLWVERVKEPHLTEAASVKVHVLHPGVFDQSSASRPLLRFDETSTWTKKGTIAVAATGSLGDQLPVKGRIGPLINSYGEDEGDGARGSVRSAPFQVRDGSWLSLRVAGGDARVGAYLVDEAGERLFGFAGKRDEELRERTLDLSPYVGQRLGIEVADDAEGAWGHILVDEITVFGPARP